MTNHYPCTLRAKRRIGCQSLLDIFLCILERNGKRTGLAAVRFAIEMEKEKLIDWKTAIRRVPGRSSAA